ncbi:MAG TPA: glycogen-binding domain-containing protein [Candidatus Udaeobacter sp.]|nr:glycogen-binding domain-containing protein [Candidatus Udaeobacter sp.]
MNSTPETNPTPENLKPVKFSCNAPHVQSVFLAGTFNGWQPDATPLVRDAEGNWSISLPLATGRYEWKFIIDGQWSCEPGPDQVYDGRDGCVCNEYGTMNRVLEVS